MSTFNIWQERWTTGDVLLADHKIEQHNEIVIEHGDHAGRYYIAGSIAKTYPVEDMKTKTGNRTIKVRAVPLTEVKKETVVL